MAVDVDLKTTFQDASKIVTNENLNTLETLFDPFHGTEICEKIPSCVKGSDKPVDLALVIDASESLNQLFTEQIRFTIERIINNINIHPEAVRLALLTYSGQTFVHFKFNSRGFNNNSAVINHLKTLRSIKGTTATNIALTETFSLLKSQDPNDGTREGVPKLVIVLTDGHSAKTPKEVAAAMRGEGILLLAVSVTPRPYVDEAELLSIAGDQSRVFTPANAQNFEAELMKHVGFGCEGLELGPDAKPRVRGATDVTCDANSMTFTVRTQRPMQGLMYAQHFHEDPHCTLVTDGSSRQISITFRDGQCGLTRSPSQVLSQSPRSVLIWIVEDSVLSLQARDGYNYNITVILQFHPLIITRADQGLDVDCFYQQPLSPQEVTPVAKRAADTDCTYRLHRYSPSQCVALDAKVGETLFHKWQCDTPPQFNYLVHDCYVKSEKSTVQILDNEGQVAVHAVGRQKEQALSFRCEVDHHFLETPNYSRFTRAKSLLDEEPYVYQEMSVFKFPEEGNVIFQCKISLCDLESGTSPCVNQVVRFSFNSSREKQEFKKRSCILSSFLKKARSCSLKNGNRN
ncbi:unnamed protein product [Heligmosomoides polygyrus]|uniref:VWFA domain-containing protein n=1 Tax=Heligmosomoides polygyrus TaxID=6339 RepID=A0A3P7U3X6_HELPZ|nr:unnamed protein product [Heligmosomoides polygyrus]